MWLKITFSLFLLLSVTEKCSGISSPVPPFTTYKHSVELQANVGDLFWTVNDAETEILFELHMKTTGWVALGISPAGGMRGADIGVGWVDHAGKVHFQDRYAFNTTRPVLDNTTSDWFALQGREQDGWTAIQFKRLLDTCDTMDVPIKAGTNNLIFAYGLIDPDLCHPNGDITYHEDRRGSRILPLRSYGNPPPEDKFAGLDSFEFRLNNYLVPPNDTTYHCKVYKAPTGYSSKRHAIAHKTLIEPANRDIVHHMLLYECNPTAEFDDENLPDGICDDLYMKLRLCTINIATAWAVGGDEMVEFPKIAGYPVGGDFEIKYYLVQMHYDNPRLLTNRRDSTGIRFYLGNELRQHDLGYLTFGSDSSPYALAIPPRVNEFIVDSYCTATATKRIPEDGITVLSAFPHTHLQGRSLWTKLIRNKTAIQYVFNAEAYDFNYQFENLLPKPVKLYPGDEIATRCVYNTMNKNEITLGGERTKDEMCLQILTYYPRMKTLSMCLSLNSETAWAELINNSTISSNFLSTMKWIRELEWTPELSAKWQQLYNNAGRTVLFGIDEHGYEILPNLPKFKDMELPQCNKQQTHVNTTITKPAECNSAARQDIFILFTLIPFIMKMISSI